ncbi:discoidin domain-containing protein [Cohnella hongkongensis]|uniref:Discoidin domain-containing protein n=1 Tax=Cohnella hongkongensis TaxID=178337 RepID=A0ABV9F9M3_9BACL
MFIRKLAGKGVVLFLPLAVLFVLGHLTSAHASGGWTKLYTGSNLSAAVVASGETRGQQFEAPDAFNSLRVSCPSWGNSVGNLTLTLYEWDTDYATSVAGTPIAKRAFLNFDDNAWLEMSFPDQPAGEYLWVLSDATELVGVYAYLDSAHPSTGYHNGAATDYDYVSEVYLANPPLTATILTPFLGQLNTTVQAGEKNDYWAGALRADPGDSSKVMYLFDWGDGTQSLSGQTIPNLPGPTDRYSGRGIHSWSSPGQYEVKARAFDGRGTPSAEWSPSVAVTVYGNAAPPSPILPVNVTASSEYGPANAAGKAVDGDPLTFWSSSAASGAYDDPQWIRFDLGSIRIVDSVELTARPSGIGFPTALKLQYSLDGAVWFDMPVLDFPVYPNPGDVPQRLETNGINARYLRIYSDMRGHDGHAYYTQLADVKIYGASENTFFTSLGETFDAYLNNMWTVFGTAKNETIGGGTDWTNTTGGIIASASTEWHYWDALKLAWTSEEEAKNHFRKVIYNIPMDADGFVWGCEYCRLHLGVQKHNTNNPMYILGAYEYYMWTRDDTFLTDALPGFTNVNAPPLPAGVNTLLDKLRKSLDWMLTNYGGASGLFVYTEPGYDGLPSPLPNASNYWDNIPFGYKDAYANALMYQATKAMADLEEALGHTAEAAAYRSYLPAMKSMFNSTFWDPVKGRYIATVDVEGGRRDYGFTFLNTMAVRFGLADANQASLIYQWLDGTRIVSGDTSQGSDIYDAFKYAPRSNTLDIASSTPYWWDGEAFGVDPGPAGNSRYGANAQNGGAILYTSFDDIVGRIEHISPDSGFGRLQAILAEFAQDELRRSRDLPNNAGFIGHGVIGEFPESGLVPAVMTHGFLGLRAELDGLRVAPKLPSSLSYAGASDIRYRGDQYKITASRAAGAATIVAVGPGSYELTVPDGQEVVVRGGSIYTPDGQVWHELAKGLRVFRQF